MPLGAPNNFILLTKLQKYKVYDFCGVQEPRLASQLPALLQINLVLLVPHQVIQPEHNLEALDCA